MEFWEAFREVPMAKRAPALGPPLCVRMLDVLADRLSYPSNFTSWDKEVAIDEEDFARCLAYTLGLRYRYHGLGTDFAFGSRSHHPQTLSAEGSYWDPLCVCL
jgi:hypothetical protein